MTLKWKDLIGTILVAALAVAYLGFVIRGEMPFIEDTRGMAAVGLILGIAAYAVFTRGDFFDRLRQAEFGVALVALGLGVAALVFAETGAGEVWLAAFMGSILVMWVVEMADHLGVVPGHHAHA